MALTAKQSRFVDEYLVDLNATQAAVRAGYSAKTAEQQAYQLLQKTSVQEAITQAKQAREQRTQITADLVLREVASIALAPLGDEVVKTADKLKALELAGKHLAMWTDKKTLLGPDGGPIQMVGRIELVSMDDDGED